MALAHNPSIVRNGLVLQLDAANPKSYPGSGTVWTDISGNGNNGTLVGGVGYTNTNGGGLVFDGVDDYISVVSNPVFTNSATFETIVNMLPGSQTNSWIFGREGCYRLTYATSNIQFVCATVNNSWYSTGTFVGANAVVVSNRVHLVTLYNGSRLQIYVNGILSGTSTADISGNVLTNAFSFQLARSNADNVAWGVGNIFHHKIYNRVLTPQEISQNFEALRGRFGI
jgi:hypothetical protein